MCYVTKTQHIPRADWLPVTPQPLFRIHKLPSQLVLVTLNQCDIFLPWSFLLKPWVQCHWLSLPSGKYGDLWSKAGNYFIPSQKPHISVQLSIQLFLVLKTVFCFTEDTNDSDSGWPRRGWWCTNPLLPRESVVARKAQSCLIFTPIMPEPPTHSSESHLLTYKGGGWDQIRYVNHHHLQMSFRSSRQIFDS